jgi:hypothetical protein
VGDAGKPRDLVPGASIDALHRRLILSQSWLQDFMRCPERARLELVTPSHGYNDATAVGTALHHFMEHRMAGEDYAKSYRQAREWLERTVNEDDFRYVKIKTLATMLEHLGACIAGFDAEVVPQVPHGGFAELTLHAPLVEDDDGWTVILAGTPDYIDPYQRVWDWKSASSEYNVRETANWAIQPTSYTFLVSTETGEDHFDFTYAIAVKPHGEMQFIDVERRPTDWDWLARIGAGALAMVRRMVDEPWPVNHTHYLCDPKWCPYWGECRGAYLTATDQQGESQ